MSLWAARLHFVCFYLKELIVATVRISLDVLTPGLKVDPCLHELSTEKYSPLVTLLLSNLISFTPGTLVVRSESGEQHILIHFLYRRDILSFRRDFLHKFERAFLGEMRRP